VEQWQWWLLLGAVMMVGGFLAGGVIFLQETVLREPERPDEDPAGAERDR
jgi:hypothetical protein